jgi:hypothetical protein
MTTFTTPVFVTGTDTYTIAVDDILDVTGDDAITWSGTDTAVTVTNNGTISDSADQSLISVAGTTGTLTFTNSLGALVDVEMKFKNLRHRDGRELRLDEWPRQQCARTLDGWRHLHRQQLRDRRDDTGRCQQGHH